MTGGGFGRRRNELVQLVEWLDKSKRIAAIFSTGLVIVALALNDIFPQLLPIASLVYLSAITAILLEIHGRTVPPQTIFASHQVVAALLYEEIQAAVAQHGKCEISWIGVTMQSAWLTLENALGRKMADGTVRNVHIRLLQSDPQYIGSVLGDDDSNPQLTREQWEHIVRFARRNQAALEEATSSIEIAQYAYMPNYHGLLINDDVLFLATVRWTGEDFSELSVPHEPFERFDRSSARGIYMIDLYKAWLERGFRSATCSRKFPESLVGGI
jgi:hypothetical protein